MVGFLHTFFWSVHSRLDNVNILQCFSIILQSSQTTSHWSSFSLVAVERAASFHHLVSIDALLFLYFPLLRSCYILHPSPCSRIDSFLYLSFSSLLDECMIEWDREKDWHSCRLGGVVAFKTKVHVKDELFIGSCKVPHNMLGRKP